MVRRGAIGLAVLVAVLVAAPATSAKVVTKLFDRALEKVRSDAAFEDAVMLEAQGMPDGNRPVDGAAQITRWRFVLANPTRGSEFASVTIDWERGEGFAKPK